MSLVEHDLTTLASRITEEHRRFELAAGVALVHALAAGEGLIQAKALVQHGDWAGWLDQNCTMSDRQARRYMRLARHRELLEANRPTSAILDVSQAEALIVRPRPAIAAPPPPTPALTFIEKPSVTDARQTASTVQAPATSRATFNRTNSNVDWAWWTWNPVTGCLHGCPYCYAREIAHRFYTDRNPRQRFEPTFHEDRLAAPVNTRVPNDPDPRSRRVFTCSMADLFGKWVPQPWIDAVFAQVRDNAQWEFLFLTKFPQRLAELAWPANAWVGTSVDQQHRVAIAEKAFRKVTAGVKWLSVEPMLEPLRFTSLDMFDWVVIGAQSATNQPDGTHVPAFMPELRWVVDLMDQADAAGCEVFLKDNLLPLVRREPRVRTK